MQPDDIAAASAGDTAKAIADNADALGLTWGWRPATVNGLSTTGPQRYMCTYDGDPEPIEMICATGDTLVTNQRVWAIKVPPGVNYVIGHAMARKFFVYKPATTTLVSDTFITDPDLIVNVPAGTRFYTVEMMLRVTSTATGVGIKLALRGPTNSRVSYAGAGPAFANTANEGDGAWFAPGATNGLTSGAFFGVSGSAATFPWGISVKAAVVTTGPGGRISWDTSQVITNPGNPTQVLRDSWMTVEDQGPVSL
jgi:hypothetical protein